METHPFTGKKNPKLLVFDCDWTLYPYDCDKHHRAPFQVGVNGLQDVHGFLSHPYPCVPDIFGCIKEAGIPVAFLSRNPSSKSLENLLRSIPIHSSSGNFTLWDSMPSEDYFHAYSSNGVGKGKDKHFAALKEISKIDYGDMIFFDDFSDNIEAAEAQGTVSVNVHGRGLTWNALFQGLVRWREREEGKPPGKN